MGHRPGSQRVSAGETAYTHVHNLQGDVIALLDGSGNKVVEYKYDARGKPIGIDGALKATLRILNPFRYRGYVRDEETGLYNIRTRYDDPAWGRFVNAVVHLTQMGSLIDHNLFAHCINNPINGV